MFKRISRITITTIGFVCGLAFGGFLVLQLAEHNILKADIFTTWWFILAAAVVSAVIFGVVSWFVSKPVTLLIMKIGTRFDEWQSDKSVSDIVVVAIALTAGLLMAFLLSGVTSKIPVTTVALVIDVVFYLLCPYICIRIVWKRRGDFSFSFLKHKKKSLIPPKILDTSVITDGRLADICKTGFIDGCIIVPDFVLSELDKISDSPDEQKSARGRRGTEMLRAMQDKLNMPIEIRETRSAAIEDTETRLLKLAKETGGTVITADPSLGKSALIHNIKVLNINDLTNAVKTVLIPGDMRIVRIVREGKERAQGLAYLDDGTMIVVENARDRVGETLSVEVQSVLQTSAGRMVFAEISEK